MHAFPVPGHHWPDMLVATLTLVLVLLYRLAAERARRKTLIELVEKSPLGTVVVQGKVQGNPPIRVRVGVGAQPNGRQHRRRLHDRQHGSHGSHGRKP